MTDIINVQPTQNEIQLGSKTDEMVKAATALEITNDEDAQRAADMIKQLSSGTKKLEEERKAITKPINDGVSKINERFKGLTDKLKKAETIIRGKLLEHQQLKEAEAQEAREAEEAARRAAQEQADREAAERAAKAPTSQASVPLPEIAPVIITKAPKPTPVARVRSDSGTVASIKKVWRARVVDVKALANARPDLVTADTTAITRLMNAAITKDRKAVELELAGVEFYQEDQLGVR